jgi:DNA-binding MarR family transcriptional regulator
MTIEEALRQKNFVSPYNKATVNLLMTHSWLTELQNPIFRSFNITKEQASVLKTIKLANNNRININYIIERMLDKNSNVSRLVDKLEMRNLVCRKTSESDKRVSEITITSEGVSLYSEIENALENMEHRLNCLSENEIEQLSFLLDKLRNGCISN